MEQRAVCVARRFDFLAMISQRTAAAANWQQQLSNALALRVSCARL